MQERPFWRDLLRGSFGFGKTYGEHSFNGRPIKAVFHTLDEVKDKFFPNRTLEELEGIKTLEEIREDLRKILELSREKQVQVDSKKVPR